MPFRRSLIQGMQFVNPPSDRCVRKRFSAVEPTIVTCRSIGSPSPWA